jgi:hypothetical protein
MEVGEMVSTYGVVQKKKFVVKVLVICRVARV